MKTLSFAAALVSLAFCLGCGSGSSHIGPQPMGNFSNASISGQYVYQLAGTDVSTTNFGAGFREAGVFTADGAGNITSGTDDFVEGSGGVFTDGVTGTYTVFNDGTAQAFLNFASGGSITLAMTVVSSSKVYLIEADSFATGAGVAEKQDTSVLSSTPSGAYTFRMHTESAGGSGGSTGSVGMFTVTGGVVSGTEDVNRNVAFNSLTLNGSLNTPSSTGRGTGTFTDSSLVTTSFIYYIVDANNIRFLSSDLNVLGLGRAEKQTGGPFSDTSLSGNYAFGANGDTQLNIGGLRAVGQFTSDGGGTIDPGTLDAVEDGITTANAGFSGTYSMTSDGRAAVTLSGSGPVNEVIWMVNPSRAFFLIQDASTVAEGTLDQQQSSSFSNASVNGQFAFLMDGYNSSFFIDRVATLQWDGAGTLILNELVNASGVINIPGFLTGTYSVASNGRTTGTIPNLSNNLVFYLVSGSKAYVLQNDASTEIDGITELQQ
jgi:hypothetical protein